MIIIHITIHMISDAIYSIGNNINVILEYLWVFFQVSSLFLIMNSEINKHRSATTFFLIGLKSLCNIENFQYTFVYYALQFIYYPILRSLYLFCHILASLYCKVLSPMYMFDLLLNENIVFQLFTYKSLIFLSVIQINILYSNNVEKCLNHQFS